MSYIFPNISTRIFLLLLIVILFPRQSEARGKEYDLVYLWHSDVELVFDYKSKLVEVFGPAVSKNIHSVTRGKKFGLIYNHNGSSSSATSLMARHNKILVRAGLKPCATVYDQGYSRLYNVSYGMGNNLTSLKKTHKKVYSYLGKAAGKNLCIEKTGSGNYILVYRRRGDRKSTYSVARKHGRLLKQTRISTSVSTADGNPVVYGSLQRQNIPVEKIILELGGNYKKEVRSAGSVKSVVTTRKPIARRYSNATVAGDFEQNVEELVKNMRRKGLLAHDETTGWVVYDLIQEKSIVDINADHVFQAASMIKPFVALAFFHQVKEGKLYYGPVSRRKMERMIQRSDNAATNWVMRHVGGPAKCDAILRNNYGHIFKKTVIKEYIPANGRTYRNRSMPSDYVRFLRALWNKEIPNGQEMRRLMALPGRDRLYSGTIIPPGTLVYNKTGSTAHLCGDMGILVPRSRNGKRYPYAIVGIIERRSRPANYGQWIASRGDVIRQVSSLIYSELRKQHHLL